MLVDMPDETNLALAKRKAVQAVIKDKSLSAVQRNKKIQDIMAGRVDLPKVLPKVDTSGSTKPAEQAKALQAGAQFWIIKSDNIEPRLEEFRSDYDGYSNRTAPFKVYK